LNFARLCQIYSKYEKYAKICHKYFGKIGHKIFCQRHQNYAPFSKSGKNYAKLATLTHTPEMHAKFLNLKIALRMRRWPEVRNLASQKFRLTPGTAIFQI